MPANYLTHQLQNWFKSRRADISTNCISGPSTDTVRRSGFRHCLLLALLLIVPDFIAGLKDVSVTIPQAVKRGSNALLICNYDMENDTLYSVKWYKGRREFYRYTPKENPAMKVFPMAAGLNVERNLSNQSHVVLLAVPLNISGKFTCEISVEAPTFQTAMVSGELEVVELPEEQAIVTGIQPRYRIGDLVDGNCSIKYSKPAANLTWTINGIVVPLHHIKTYQIERYDESNLESVVSALHFMVTTQHFIKGQMRLKCTASIFDIFKEEIESVIEEDRPRIMASGRSYDMHNNYPYEQHASANGFEDHNESFLTYSASDITSSATTIHVTPTLKLHWKYIWTELMTAAAAAVAAIRATSYHREQHRVELEPIREQRRYFKWVSKEGDDEGVAMKSVVLLELFAARGSVVYGIFAAIFASVFLFVLTCHFISCQRLQKKSAATGAIATVWLSDVDEVAATRAINGAAVIVAASKSTTATALVKRTLKRRKSFHNCVGKYLRSLNVRLLAGVFVQGGTAAVNPLQKLPLTKQQQTPRNQHDEQEQKNTAIWHHAAHFQCNANQRLPLTVAGSSASPHSPTTCDALTFDTMGVSINTPRVIGSSNATSSYSSSNNQAIANFTKDTPKDQTLLMMIAQRFDCQHVDDFVTAANGLKQKQQQQHSMNNQNLMAIAKVLAFNWQESSANFRPPCSVC